MLQASHPVWLGTHGALNKHHFSAIFQRSHKDCQSSNTAPTKPYTAKPRYENYQHILAAHSSFGTLHQWLIAPETPEIKLPEMSL